MVTCEAVKIVKVPIKGKKDDSGEDDNVTFIHQFVKEVCDFSSQYGSNSSISYTAYNIAGNPSKFPDYGDFPQAFVMRTYGPWWDEAPSRLTDFMPQNNDKFASHDFIDVEYQHEVYPIRVSLYETYNPGSLVGIWAENNEGKWQRLWRGEPQFVAQTSRIFSPPLELCAFKTKKLHLEFNHSLLDYYTELDALMLIGTTELILPLVGDFQSNSISGVLRKLGKPIALGDNLTPDYTTVHEDLETLTKSFSKYCVLYKSVDGKIPKGKLASKLGLHCHYVPPIEEAFNSLQQFLQEDFPKLMKEINLSSAKSAQSITLSSDGSPVNDNTCGSFSVLPDETILKILKNLDLKSLCRCCRVNRHFNNIAKDALLYTSLNLKPYWHCIDPFALKCLVPRCQYLQRLDLSWCGNYGVIEASTVVELIGNCGNFITHLYLNCCRFVEDSVMIQISKICKNLKELSLRNCTLITREGFSSLENLCCLERLELYRTGIETTTLCSILRNNQLMRHLNVAGLRDSLIMDDVVMELANSCPNLESIDCWKSNTLTPNGVKALARCSKLREVDFCWCGGIGAPMDSLRLLFTSCKRLKKVFLGALRGTLTDRDVEPLLFCQELEQLDLLGARLLSPDLCLRILMCCTSLKMIDLSFCDGISDLKVQEWRQLYPNVSIKRSFQAAGRLGQ